MAEQGASLVATDNTQISAAAHTVALAVLKLNRLVPKALLSILGRLSRWRADRRKRAVESRISRARDDIAMNEELLKLSGEQSIELPKALETRMQKQRDEPQRWTYFTMRRMPTSETGPVGVTRVELSILNRRHNILIDQLQAKLEQVDRDQRRWLKAAVIPTELFCLVAGLVVWCSIVIGLILGLGEFNKQDSFVTAFTIITSVATSEYDYFRRIVLAGRRSSGGLGETEQQPPRREQDIRHEAEPEPPVAAELSTPIRARPSRDTIQPELEELV